MCQPEPGRGPEMVLIAPGTFQQGSSKREGGRSDDESPPHSVTIPEPFAIGRCEVTVGEFRAFVEAEKYQTDAQAQDGGGCYYWNAQEKTVRKDPNRYWDNPGF